MKTIFRLGAVALILGDSAICSAGLNLRSWGSRDSLGGGLDLFCEAIGDLGLVLPSRRIAWICLNKELNLAVLAFYGKSRYIVIDSSYMDLLWQSGAAIGRIKYKKHSSFIKEGFLQTEPIALK